MHREVRKEESQKLGQLMVEVYSSLEGFPTPHEQPKYYEMLANIADFAHKKDAQVLVAASAQEDLLGEVVYFADMAEYGAGGSARGVENASGIRLLGVSPKSRGMGVGRALTVACIERAREKGHAQVVLHTTRAMKSEWQLYERLGFERSEDLDFMQEQLPVFGFRLQLQI